MRTLKLVLLQENMKGLKVFSAFDGISCGQLAFQRAGIPVDTYFASEICDYSIKITKKNFPNTIEVGDIREVNCEDYKDIDIVIGGSPCQSFSFAGTMNGMTTKEKQEITTLEQYLELKEKGFEFEGYSYLFWEYVRILKGIKPKYFLLENVKMAEKWKKVITDALGVEPILINSELVSAQSRERLQTVPDNYTLIDGIKKKERYEALGNGWTVDVIAHIFSGLKR